MISEFYKRISIRYFPDKVSLPDRIILSVLSQCALPFAEDSKKRLIWLGYLQNSGINIIPERYFEPIPKVDDVDIRTRSPVRIGRMIPETGEIPEIRKIVLDSGYIKKFRDIFQPIEHNHMFGFFDSLVYFYLVQKFKPSRIVEVGSGYSAYIALKGSEKLPTRVAAIEPFPDIFLKDLENTHPAPRFRLIREKVQDLNEPDLFNLGSGDILFIDSTHVCNIGGDLPEIFSGILPKLASGVIVHIHDVSWPYEYPRSQAYKSGRFYNELYLLTTLMNHGCYEYIFGSYDFLLNNDMWLSKTTALPFNSGSSLWIRKV